MSETDFVLSTSPNVSPAATDAPTVGDLDEHDVAERVLGVVGDPDPDDRLPSTARTTRGRSSTAAGRERSWGATVSKPAALPRRYRGGAAGCDAGADRRDVADGRVRSEITSPGMPRIHDATWKPSFPGKSLPPSMNPGIANISRNVASLPHHVTSNRCMPKNRVATAIGHADQQLRGPARRRRTRSARRRR